MKDMKITDENGRTITIREGETYTVIYTAADRPFRFQVLTNLYLNYPNDDHIGHDTEDGMHDPIDDRIYFDKCKPDHVQEREEKNIIAVFTTKEWQMKLRDIIK